MEHDKSHRGNASQFFVAGELCRRGYAAVVTLGNTPNTDVLCSNRGGTKFVHIQVKTFLPGTKTCSVGLKAERRFGPTFFWVLAGIPPQCRRCPSSTSSFHAKTCLPTSAHTTKTGLARLERTAGRTVTIRFAP